MKGKKNLIETKINEALEKVEVTLRENVPLSKGVILTPAFLEENEQLLRDYFDYFIMYPDLFLDLIKPTDSSFDLYFYQRIVLRAVMRYKEVYITACRAFSKSFISIMGMILQCIFIPKTKRFICAPNKNQAAQIAREKILEIYDLFPLIRKEIIGGHISDTPGNFGKDYVTLKFRNGSQFDVVGALDSTRGGRRHGGLIDEIRDHDEVEINEVVLPLLNVSRREPDGTVNPREPNRQVICMTSAGSKATFAYDKLKDFFENSIMNPQDSFVFGCDYRIPVMHGLLDRLYINNLKMSPSYSEQSFASEYMSIWGGGSSESWFNFDKLSKYRTIKNPEKRAINRHNPNEFYLLSTDVGEKTPRCIVICSCNYLNCWELLKT